MCKSKSSKLLHHVPEVRNLEVQVVSHLTSVIQNLRPQAEAHRFTLVSAPPPVMAGDVCAQSLWWRTLSLLVRGSESWWCLPAALIWLRRGLKNNSSICSFARETRFLLHCTCSSVILSLHGFHFYVSPASFLFSWSCIVVCVLCTCHSCTCSVNNQ